MEGEKIYRTMKKCAIWNIALGITAIAVGVSVGVGTIITGCALLRRKSEIMF
ncbi:hypothetical protein P261_00465 [Lachnospiraceae bacterium TWA4]|nr:hypothetical protein P261_00465 [Lachnospiraceae bacterium TWA4]